MTELMRDEHGFGYDLPGPFSDATSIMREHRERGGYYFEPETMRYFRARCHRVVAGAILIDSIRHDDDARVYRLTVMTEGRGMSRIPDPRDGATTFDTLDKARRAAERVCKACGVPSWYRSANKLPRDWAYVADPESVTA